MEIMLWEWELEWEWANWRGFMWLWGAGWEGG